MSDDQSTTPPEHVPGEFEAPAYTAPPRDELWSQYPAAQTTQQTASERRKPNTVPIVAALMVGALVGGVSGAGVAVWAVTSSQENVTATGPGSSPLTVTVNDVDDATLITAIAASAAPSVVTISVAGGNASGTGSGVLLTNDGYIVTNTHVVTLDGVSGHPTINVQTYDGRLYTADLVGTDPLTDLAVIKIEGTTFQPVKFADSGKLNVGDVTVAIGAPLGLSNTVTNGIVSALNRSITIASSAAPDEDTPEQTPQSPFDFWEFDRNNPNDRNSNRGGSTGSQIFLPVIQTDAAINPGNSGGALLDASGKLIGVNVAIATAGSSSAAGSIGVGFSIPSNLVKRITDELIKNGVASHALLGVSILDTTLDEKIADKTIVGASVQSVTDGGPGATAGIRVGDVITGFNDAPITGSIDLTAQVRAAAAGSDATVTLVRDGKVLTLDVKLGTLE